MSAFWHFSDLTQCPTLVRNASKRTSANAPKIMGRAVASTQRSNQSHHLAWIGFAHAFRLTKSHARKSEFAEAIQRDLGRPVPWPKIFRLCRRANQLH